MPLVDVLDDTFLRSDRAAVRAQTGTSWTAWLPDLSLTVVEERGDRGVRWAATDRPGSSGRPPGLVGSAEVWLEEVPGGTVAHLYVRLDPPASSGTSRRARRLPDRVRRTWKRGLHAWKDGEEGDGST